MELAKRVGCSHDVLIGDEYCGTNEDDDFYSRYHNLKCLNCGEEIIVSDEEYSNFAKSHTILCNDFYDGCECEHGWSSFNDYFSHLLISKRYSAAVKKTLEVYRECYPHAKISVGKNKGRSRKRTK